MEKNGISWNASSFSSLQISCVCLSYVLPFAFLQRLDMEWHTLAQQPPTLPLYSTLLWHSSLLVKEASHNYTHVCAATAKKGIINTARIKKKKFVHCYCKNICPESKKRCLKNVLNFCEHSCLKVDGMLKGAWRRGWKAIWEKCIWTYRSKALPI